MSLHVIPLLAIIFADFSAASQDCKYSKLSSAHSFCKERNPDCEIFESSLNDEEKSLLVKVHNEMRNKIALGEESCAGGMPPAADMLEMEWDDELASIAQKYAEQCKMEHDCLECREVERFKVGQNLFQSLSTEKKPKEESFKKAVEDWYSEIDVFSNDVVPSYKQPPDGQRSWGHLTQIIWSQSWKLGCGSVQYKHDNWNSLLLVCNYGPGGNVLERPVYEKGKACSACPENSCCGEKSSFPGLCKMTSSTSS